MSAWNNSRAVRLLIDCGESIDDFTIAEHVARAEEVGISEWDLRSAARALGLRREGAHWRVSRAEVARARHLVSRLLDAGVIQARVILEVGDEAGICPWAMYRARDSLGRESRHIGQGPGSFYWLPAEVVKV